MRMRILTPKGVVEADLPDPFDRSTVGSHWNAVAFYTRSGRTARLDKFGSTKVGDGIRLETDPDAIDGWWFAGELDFLEVYTS